MREYVRDRREGKSALQYGNHTLEGEAKGHWLASLASYNVGSRSLSQVEYALALALDVLAALDDRDPEVVEARAERLSLDW